MGRVLSFCYGILAYLLFFAAFLYTVGFVAGVVVPKTIDNGTPTPMLAAVVIDLVLMSVFAIQHSVMARQGFKRWWTKIVSPAVERSTYVLAATLALILLLWQWRPIPAVLWHVTDANAAMALLALAALGWVIVLLSTFLINHFELFGLHQVANHLADRPMPEPRVQDAAVLQAGASPHLSWLHHRLLVDAHDDLGASAVRRGDHGLHLRRHRP